MRIVHVITGMNLGGAERIVYSLITAPQPTCQYTLVYLSPSRSHLLEKLANSCIDIHFFNCKNLLGLLRALTFLLCASHKFSRLYFHMYHACLIGTVVPLVLRRHAYFVVHHAEPLSPSTASIIHQLIQFLLSIVVKSEYVTTLFPGRNCLSKHVNAGFIPRRAKVFTPPSDLSQSSIINSNYPTTRFRSFSGSEIIFGCAARWHPIKNHSYLFEVFSWLPDRYTLYLCGSGLELTNKELNSAINFYGLKDRVKLFGEVEDMPSFFSSLDFHILLSTHESFGLSTLEAMQFGVPSWSSATGEQVAIIRGSTPVLSLDNAMMCSRIIRSFVEVLSETDYLQLSRNSAIVASDYLSQSDFYSL